MRQPKAAIIVLTIVYLVLKISIINTPSPEKPPEECIEQAGGCGFVFDEAHYVRAVRRMIGGEAANNEHPPLAKYLIMYSILAFGDAPFAWRLPSVLSGVLTLPILYLLARRLIGDSKAALLAVLLFALDVTSFNISSIAILDSPSLLFALAGTYLFISGRQILGTVPLALAVLSKTSAAFTALGVILYTSLVVGKSGEDTAMRISRSTRSVVLYSLLIFAILTAGLAVYDVQFRAFPQPFAHLDFILSYHSSLRFSCSEPHLPLYCIHRDDGGSTVVDLPLNWVLPVWGYSPMGFYVVTVVIDGREQHPILYYGIQSPLWWLFWIAAIYCLPSGVKNIVQYFRGLKTVQAEGREAVDTFFTVWVALNYLVYFPLAYLLSRWVYPFYFYFTLPVLAIALADILRRRDLPDYVTLIVLGAQFMWFFIYYPVRSEEHMALLRLLGLPA
ncbi:MAG: glycosyltransferase family 39 protein [Nitrososphaerota archaeon]|nr:glycosyltransferase family 39 protein [Candidatus Calditenuaceae archaeon]MDW8073373.1 glycosyltransferase family 39 protein [Nitrososphaerota archaeon]